MTCRDELRLQCWEDHKLYHQSRINQSLHFFSACSFIGSYVFILAARHRLYQSTAEPHPALQFRLRNRPMHNLFMMRNAKPYSFKFREAQPVKEPGHDTDC